MAAISICACGSADKPRPKAKLEWRQIGSWAGHSGNTQTESFEIGNNQIRIRWKTNAAKPGDSGTFHVTVNSAVSGREIADAINQRGPGHDTAYLAVDPHYSFLIIDSSGLDWSVTLEEPYAVDIQPSR